MPENNTKKTINTSTVVIIILAVVIVLLLIFGTILFFVMRSNKDKDLLPVDDANASIVANNEITNETSATSNETTNTTTTNTQTVSNGSVSDDWKDCEFIFNNKTYKLYVPYSDLKSDGWSFDLADYGYSNGYVMNPGDKSYRNN